VIARALVLLALLAGCAAPLVRGSPTSTLLVTRRTPLDTAPKEQLRLVPPEVLLRTFVQLSGARTPLEAQARARGQDGGQLFDAFGDYLSALGFPDYRNDLPRAVQTNALMVAAFERLAVALCDRAVEHDLRPATPGPRLFAFDQPPQPLDEAEFVPRFDSLHRAVLGYPAALAPGERTRRFYALYRATIERHARPDAPRSRFSPPEAGWAAVCYGLLRHPEFHLY
jgi:hypothetical protein